MNGLHYTLAGEQRKQMAQVISEQNIKLPESLAKQGISGQIKEKQNNDKSTFHLPRQAKVGQFMSEVVGCCGANRCKS